MPEVFRVIQFVEEEHHALHHAILQTKLGQKLKLLVVMHQRRHSLKLQAWNSMKKKVEETLSIQKAYPVLG